MPLRRTLLLTTLVAALVARPARAQDDLNQELEQMVKAAVKKLKKMGALREVIGRDAGRREDKSFVVAGSQTAPGFGSATRERVRNERNP